MQIATISIWAYVEVKLLFWGYYEKYFYWKATMPYSLNLNTSNE